MLHNATRRAFLGSGAILADSLFQTKFPAVIKAAETCNVRCMRGVLADMAEQG